MLKKQPTLLGHPHRLKQRLHIRRIGILEQRYLRYKAPKEDNTMWRYVEQPAVPFNIIQRTLLTMRTGLTRSEMAWRSTVSVCTHTPSTQSTTTKAPSVTRSAAVTCWDNETGHTHASVTTKSSKIQGHARSSIWRLLKHVNSSCAAAYRAGFVSHQRLRN